MGFIGDIFGAGGSSDAAGTYWEAAKKWDELDTPSAMEEARKAKELFDSGLITPEEFQAVLQKKSSLEAYQGDPRLREAQMRSLGELERVGTEGGMTAEDRARLATIQQQNATQARGAREAGKIDLARRGIKGGGLDAMNAAVANQGAATANFMGGTNVAAEAQRRALDAITRSGEMASNVRTQEFGEAEKKAAAADAINRFNTQNQNVVGQANIEARNKARTDAINMGGADWDRKRKKLEGWTGAYTGQAPYQEREGQQIGNAIGGGLSAAGGLALGAIYSDENVKENVQPASGDINEFLDDLKPYSYDYKNPEKYGEGRQVGVMAQDMEKNPVGKQFVSKDAEGVKRIDYGKAQGTMLAILKTLADRVDELEGGRGV